MVNKFLCQLIDNEIDETICYDIQMVNSNMINNKILNNYDFSIDDNKLANTRVERYCRNCPYNQLPIN